MKSISLNAMAVLFGLIFACAIAGKFGGCALAARAGGFAWREAACVGMPVNTRGLMELIVIGERALIFLHAALPFPRRHGLLLLGVQIAAGPCAARLEPATGN